MSHKSQEALGLFAQGKEAGELFVPDVWDGLKEWQRQEILEVIGVDGWEEAYEWYLNNMTFLKAIIDTHLYNKS